MNLLVAVSSFKLFPDEQRTESPAEWFCRMADLAQKEFRVAFFVIFSQNQILLLYATHLNTSESNRVFSQTRCSVCHLYRFHRLIRAKPEKTNRVFHII